MERLSETRLVEYDGTGILQRTFVFGNYIDEVLLMSDGTIIRINLPAPLRISFQYSAIWRAN